MRHIIGILLQNESGALVRVACLFSNRGYNIESLSVAPTEQPSVSRITLVTSGSDATIQQIVSQLHKLIDVVSVENLTGGEHVEREMALLRLVVKAGADAALLDCLQAAGARVVHSNGQLLLVEMTGAEADISSLLAAVADHASLDAVARSGPLGLPHYGSRSAS
jgi:acetolactate synthase-1/3 small subunit